MCTSAITEGFGSKREVPVCRHHAMKTYMRREGKILRILDLRTRWKWLGSRSDCFTQAEDPRLPLNNRQVGVYTPVLRHGGGGPILYSATAIGTATPSGGPDAGMKEVRRSLGDNAVSIATSRIYSWQSNDYCYFNMSVPGETEGATNNFS
jgi:hypothetical protein